MRRFRLDVVGYGFADTQIDGFPSLPTLWMCLHCPEVPD